MANRQNHDLPIKQLKWDDENIHNILENLDPKIIKYDNNYQIKPSMLVLYNLNIPYQDKWHSVVLDTEDGVVLTALKSKRLLSDFAEKFVLPFSHQHHFHKELANHYKHTFAAGRYAFFSINGYSLKHTHWISLHQIKCYHMQKSSVVFHSNGSTKYSFKFTNIPQYFEKDLFAGLNHAYVVRKILLKTLRPMGFNYLRQEQSLLTEHDYLYETKTNYVIDNFTVQKMRQVLDKELVNQTVNYLNNELELSLQAGFTKSISRHLINRYRI